MRLVKKINTSVALCVDESGRQLVALGKGIGFLNIQEEVPLSQITRTFYDVDARYVDALSDLSPEVVELASQIVDTSQGLLSYELSPNLSFVLADHLQFAIKRAEEGIMVSMPLAFDVQQQYPVEYRIGRWAVGRVNQELGANLPVREAIGIAMAFVNNAAAPKEGSRVDDDQVLEQIIEESTTIVESTLGVAVDRDSLNYARFATHIQYLFQRAQTGISVESGNVDAYELLRKQYPEVSSCADLVADVFYRRTGRILTDEERLYLMLHINRIASKTAT